MAVSENKSRMRFVVGELCHDESGFIFRYLPNNPDFDQARAEGFVCYPAFRKTEQTYRDGVVETFLRRIPPRKRGDFCKYLLQWRLAEDIEMSDFALLGHTGAKLPNDGFSLVNPYDNVHAPYEFYIEVAGFRHQDGISLNDVGERMKVNFVSEPNNLHDSHAVRVEVDGSKIGYANKIQCAAFNRWLEHNVISAWIERINGTPERSLIYVFGRVDMADARKAVA